MRKIFLQLLVSLFAASLTLPAYAADDVHGGAIMDSPVISGYAFVDLNENGAFDNEPTVTGIDIVATDTVRTIHVWTDASGYYSMVLSPGRWYISAYQNFNMVFDADYEIASDGMIMIPLQPTKLYLPLATQQ